jgi:hypothetical protein
MLGYIIVVKDGVVFFGMDNEIILFFNAWLGV